MTDTRFAGASVEGRLADAWLTRALTPRSRTELAAIGRFQRVPAGTVLFREGDVSRTLSVVLDGRVALRLRVAERGHLTILTVDPGDVLGWSAVVPPFRATSTGVAVTETDLIVFDGTALREALAADCVLAGELYPQLLGAVARRLEGTRLQLLDLFSQPTPGGEHGG